ncbi:MAG TPA: phosphoribosylformylglycinamidine cyclo-ligase [Leptospiraceae bacterium]|nr:phosphoribosylformylglycinamidine cyclo-ligase [Leptospiraceae bacterium]HNE23409.1 phosphoribosylformylglycinamidine cyclo-ligase [Leptospiraceae bacterium]
MDYKTAGVDTHAGQQFVKLIGPAVASTKKPHVLGGLGGFAAMSDLSFLKEYKRPVLLSTTDGVGTKLHLAKLFNRHETVGIDLVAMCANDLLVTGARALIFLDYVACGKLNPEQMAIVVQGVAEGCKQAGCSLVGGETAEHPGLLDNDEYDLAGFCAGVAEHDLLITGKEIREGDVILALPSSGIHSNGVSLIRKIFLKEDRLPDSASDRDFLLNDILLKPTRIYEPFLRGAIDNHPGAITGMVHITGGGFYENVPRIIPDGLCADIDTALIPVPALFDHIMKKGSVARKEMYSVYNMGAGMIMAVRPDQVESVVASIQQAGLSAHKAGIVIRNTEKVLLRGI